MGGGGAYSGSTVGGPEAQARHRAYLPSETSVAAETPWFNQPVHWCGLFVHRWNDSQS